MIALGGGVIGIDGVEGTYLAKGEEDKEDFIAAFSQLSDLMVLRDSDPKTLEAAVHVSKIPVINGGIGTEEHAAAGLARGLRDYCRFDGIDGMKICLYGAPGPSRSAKAFIKFYSLFNTEIYEDIVMPELGLPEEIYQFVKKQGKTIKKVKLEDVIDKIDFLLVEGIPTKFVDKNLVEKYLSLFKPITMEEVSKMKKNAIFQPISPRIIQGNLFSVTKETDSDSRSGLADFVKYWKIATMALIVKLLNLKA
jgi:aspartate carbamoyltransferase catalytic subunit